MILLRQVTWKVASLRLSFSAILQHFDPYRSADSVHLAVFTGFPYWSHAAKAALALLRHDVMSSSVPP